MKIAVVTTAALLALQSICFAEKDQATRPANAEILLTANSILTNLQSSHYSFQIDIDATTGKYVCDCSGFSAYVLKQAAPESFKSLPLEKGERRPRAICFYSAFTNAANPLQQPGWQQISKLEDTQPGDLIAWRKNVIKPGSTSGHVMIVMKKPVREKDGTYRVGVLDSSSMKHADDSRHDKQNGVGTGSVFIEVNDKGEPISYRMIEAGHATTCPIAIGRPVLSP